MTANKFSLEALPLLVYRITPPADAPLNFFKGLNMPLVLLAALGMFFLCSGCASTSAGVGKQPVAGCGIGLPDDESESEIEKIEEPRALGPASVRDSHVLKTAFSQVGRPYRYGGTKPETGFDCSGFVKWVYGQYNINLPRSSGDMISVGNFVARKDLRPGDLVFFGKRKSITHVGIYTGDNKYIHSPSSGKRIQESSLDDRARGEYYAGARRILQNPGPYNINDKEKSTWMAEADLRLNVAKASAQSEAGQQTQAAAVEPPSAGFAPPASNDGPAKARQHRVAAGDTFYKLARKYNTSPELLAKANKIGNYRTAVLKPGQIIVIAGQENEEKASTEAGRAAVSPESSAFDEPVPSAALEAERTLEEPGGFAAPVPAPAPKAKALHHKIENGDTFYAIAKKYGVKASELARANNIEDINKAVLKPGKMLAIPAKTPSGGQAVAVNQAQPKAAASAGGRHIIENGDTFYAIANKYGVKASELARANNIEDINKAVLKPGKMLAIPAKTSSGGQAVAGKRAEQRRHRVENGDTFYGVAKKYGVKSADLAKANNIKDITTAVLRPGQTLLVP